MRRARNGMWFVGAAIVVLMIVAGMLAGCTEMPVRYAPTEEQKQAADLAVTNLQALAPHVDQPGQPVRQEALAAAQVTQSYVGLPEKRPVSLAAENAETIGRAAQVATRRPTVADTAYAVIGQAEQVANVGFNLLDVLLAGAGGILATWGGGKVAGRIGQIRSQRDEYGQKLGETFEALRQIVRGVDNLDDETRAKVKQAQSAVQDAATQMIVAEARRS
ncbi:MAG: hypothetical protein BWX88_05295 [Planctomycetes bacterium ADurb.Bin126]|nr:MAG: hypothetical protein BWX88_05295 [Planctomycetes bacterium ADurb.Bin126]HOD84588.1 hypothetical protein [Phycisphaerae bacterium]HQL76535.1 hypothetical protein [Phycisphaerae bacterium]